MSLNDAPTKTFLSLKPVPIADKEPKNLADLISRVNAQPGGFRQLTEAQLRDAIVENDSSNNEDVSVEDVVMVDAANDDDADTTVEDAALARLEVLKNVDCAGNAAMLVLDSLSLLLSKQNPTQASLTLSQQLRDMVGIGTLGVDRLDEPTMDEQRSKDAGQVAIGWTLMEINRTRDAAVKAAALLEKEVDIESRYWSDVMAIKNAGWSICRVPHQRHTLGVRFGFSETSSEFKNSGLAPLRRSEDGSVELDLGRLGGVSECLVVTYLHNDQVVGRSVPTRRRRQGSSSLEARVLEARNTIFAQELWHELIKEARTLAAYDVRLQGSRLRCQTGPDAAIIIELLPLASCPSAEEDESLPHNGVAEAISLGLHILLSYAHRHSELMRTRPMPPHISRSRQQNQTYALLRPVIGRLASTRSIESCTKLVGNLSKALRKAGLASSFILRSPPPAPPADAPSSSHASASQVLVRRLLQPREFAIDFTILTDVSLTLRGRTFLFPITSTHFNATLPPDSPLSPSCVPCPDGYPDLSALAAYLDTTVARALTSHFLARLLSSPSCSRRPWAENVVGTSIVDKESQHWSLRLSAHREDDETSSVVLASTVVYPEDDSRVRRRIWKWTSSSSSPATAGLESESRPLADVVDEAAAMSPS
ncbi:hypothetical protein L249_0714 [Ophiocordyceps polyrhachis-furcata BCC 54312]|uniref:Mediator of RNA polymerase II transcription subunit 17 n=1 Tax=Ophiocordyceps polyrhachis-furcata BCC 54312 TaxID=1330021 RepID=A0A367LCI3_9HYPO|nr:hypothetical protein L249_0714 [Ophiocordyceps polyrhachis-furcata BCC 54312]